VTTVPGVTATFSNQQQSSFHNHVVVNSKTRLCSAAQDTSTILDDLSIILDGPDLPPVPLTSKRLFMVRHGEVINPGGDRPVYYGSQDVKLSPLGELEAKVRSNEYILTSRSYDYIPQ
jgi:hypothetical protein